ncbi:MAG: hypothetical protein ACYDBQ_01365 [Thermoplasmatota archaeon]
MWRCLAASAFCLLAGCIETAQTCVPAPGTAFDAPAYAPASLGKGFTDVTVHFAGPGNRPLPARALVMWGTNVPPGARPGLQGAINGVYAGFPPTGLFQRPVTASNRTLGVYGYLQAGPDGVAHIHLPDQSVLIVDAWLDGWTREHVVAGDLNWVPRTATLTLYPREIEAEFHGNLTQTAETDAGGTRTWSYTWHPTLQELAAAPWGTAEAKRISNGTATLTWTNGMASRADLALDVRDPGDPNAPAYSVDNQNQFTSPGPQIEQGAFSGPQAASWFDANGSFRIGPEVRNSVLLSPPMPYQGSVHVTLGLSHNPLSLCYPSNDLLDGIITQAQFDARQAPRDDNQGRGAPGLGAAVLAAFVFAAATIGRRR